MQIACKVCNKVYDFDTQPTICPHLENPKECKRHNRKNCGNLECQNENKTLEFPKLEKVRKNASNNN